jgi:hypothetical protein
MVPNGARKRDEESLAAEIAGLEAVLAERRHRFAGGRAQARSVGDTLLRAIDAAARVLLRPGTRPAPGARAIPDPAARRR